MGTGQGGAWERGVYRRVDWVHRVLRGQGEGTGAKGQERGQGKGGPGGEVWEGGLGLGF